MPAMPHMKESSRGLKMFQKFQGLKFIKLLEPIKHFETVWNFLKIDRQSSFRIIPGHYQFRAAGDWLKHHGKVFKIGGGFFDWNIKLHEVFCRIDLQTPGIEVIV